MNGFYSGTKAEECGCACAGRGASWGPAVRRVDVPSVLSLETDQRQSRNEGASDASRSPSKLQLRRRHSQNIAAVLTRESDCHIGLSVTKRAGVGARLTPLLSSSSLSCSCPPLDLAKHYPVPFSLASPLRNSPRDCCASGVGCRIMPLWESKLVNGCKGDKS